MPNVGEFVSVAKRCPCERWVIALEVVTSFLDPNMIAFQLLSFLNLMTALTHRIKVHTVSGTQICVAVVGEVDELLTRPALWTIIDALVSPHWAHFSTAEELAEDPQQKVHILGK